MAHHFDTCVRQGDIKDIAFENASGGVIGTAEWNEHHLQSHSVQFAPKFALIPRAECQQAGQDADGDPHTAHSEQSTNPSTQQIVQS